MLVAVTGTENVDQSIIARFFAFSVVDRNKTDRDVIFPVFKSQSLLGIKSRVNYLCSEHINFSQKGVN